MARNQPPLLTNPSAPGAVSSFQLTHVAGNTGRPNANDMPKQPKLVGSFDGTRNQPTDARQGSPKAIQNKPGEVPKGRYGVFVNGGRTLLGHVGGKATSATARRFGSYGAKLAKVQGRQAWLGETLAEVSSRGATKAQVTPAKN